MRFIMEKWAPHLFGDAVWFRINWHECSQNNRYGCAENRMQIREAPLHDGRFGVWCAVSATRLIGPFIFSSWDHKFTAVWHEFLIRFLLSLVIFSAKWRTQPRMLRITFLVTIRKGWLCPHSLDLYPCHFYLWNMLKDTVYIYYYA